MKLKLTPPYIPKTKEEGDPFMNCKLDRKKYADALTTIVNTYSDGFVMAINNKWGSGKTTFVEMWKQQLKNEGFQTLYFNAWENDFQTEVMVALLAELKELQDKGKRNFNSLVKSGAILLNKTAPIIASGIVSRAVGDKVAGELVEVITELTTGELKKQIESFTDAKKGLIDFRNSLKKYVAQVNKGKPVIFIIDELDRCRPNYAVSVLENIKHLFSVEGIVFVLSIDKVQLGHAIRGVYGSEQIDSEEYLRRFIDLEYNLPTPDRRLFIKYLYNYFEFNLFINSNARRARIEFHSDVDVLENNAIILFADENFTLRQIEKNFARIRLTLNTFSEEQHIFTDIVVLLSYIYDRYPEIYNKIENSEYTLQELVDVMDPIFESFKDPEHRGTRLILYASLLNKYHNQLLRLKKTTEDIVELNKSNQRISLVVKSRLENEKNNLASFIKAHQYIFNKIDIDLNFIQKRYSLVENLRE